MTHYFFFVYRTGSIHCRFKIWIWISGCSVTLFPVFSCTKYTQYAYIHEYIRRICSVGAYISLPYTCYIYTHMWAFQVGCCLRLCWFCRPAWFQQNCCIPYEGETTVNNVLIRLLHNCFDIVALICVHRVMRSSVVYAMSMERGQAWWWSYQGTMKTRIMHHSEGSSSQGEGYPSLYAGWSWQGTIMDFHLNCILSLRLGEGLFTLTIGRRV